MQYFAFAPPLKFSLSACVHYGSARKFLAACRLSPYLAPISSQGPTFSVSSSSTGNTGLMKNSPQAATVLTVSSPSGAVGTSVMAAILAKSLSARGCTVALIDGDPQLGGLDVLLGLEADAGMRWSDVDVPMGRLDGHGLLSQLLDWEGVSVMSSNPWRAHTPQEWEQEAVMRALASVCDVLVVDSPQHVPQQALLNQDLRQIVLVEMSVVGIARARGSVAQEDSVFVSVPAVRACGPCKRLVKNADAAEYLGVDLLDFPRYEPAFEKSLTAGLGIPSLPRKYEEFCSTIIERLLPEVTHAHRKRR